VDRSAPDTSAAVYERGIAVCQCTHVFNRIVCRRYPATDHARLFQAYFLRHFENHVAWNRNVFGETADVPTGDRRAVGFPERRRRRTIDAEGFTPAETIEAASALVAHADDNRGSLVKA